MLKENSRSENKILIVDDQLSNLKVLDSVLKNNNYKVKKAMDGETALISVETDQPDLILLDIKMPNLDGYEVCQKIKSNPQTQDIPIIFISALDEVFDKVKAFEVGGVDYITKPFQEEEVLARIKSQLTIKRQQHLLEIKQQKQKEQIKLHRETEAILYQSRALISSILNSSLDGIAAMEAVRDRKTGNIIDFSCLVVNPIIARMFNQEPEDLIGILVVKKFLNKVNPHLFSAFVNLVETGASLEQDISFNNQQEQQWYHFIAVKLGDGFAITIRDITERKNLELNLAQTNKELEAFSYSVAHDLRNPLSNIKGFLYLLNCEFENYPQLNNKLQIFLEMMTQSSEKMEKLINDLMRLSKIKKLNLKIEKFNLSNIITKILREFEAKEPERKIELNIDPYIEVKGDQGLISIAMDNLIGNAWKYSATQDLTIIEFGIVDYNSSESPHILEKFSLFVPEEKLCQNNLKTIYFIKDNGIGFDLENIDQLFTPFQRFHDSDKFEGTGIGLSIVQRIIHRHHGYIWCDSKIDQGTTFYFTLG